MVEPAAPIERLLVLGEMLGVIKISAAAQHIHGFILARPRKVLQSLVLFIIGYEICINGGITILRIRCLGSHGVRSRGLDLTFIEVVGRRCLL